MSLTPPLPRLCLQHSPAPGRFVPSLCSASHSVQFLLLRLSLPVLLPSSGASCQLRLTISPSNSHLNLPASSVSAANTSPHLCQPPVTWPVSLNSPGCQDGPCFPISDIVGPPSQVSLTPARMQEASSHCSGSAELLQGPHLVQVFRTVF